MRSIAKCALVSIAAAALLACSAEPRSKPAPVAANAQPQAPPVADHVRSLNEGVTSMQASEAWDARTRAAQVIAEADMQINRLSRLQETAPVERRADVRSTSFDLTSRRARVEHDLRELDSASPEAMGVALAKLRMDYADLYHALHASYVVIPPAGQGLPQPAPLPP